MHPLQSAFSVKRSGQSLGHVNNVAGQNQKDNFLLHVYDTKRRERWLVDGGAFVSLLPPTPQQRRDGPNGVQLKAANGTNIACYGNVSRTITIGETNFTYTFTIADVKQRILGSDFLANFYLAPNHRDASLISLHDFSTLPAEHAASLNYSPINFVDQADDPFYKLLDQYPEIQTPQFTIKDPQHGVRHHIPTGDAPPCQSRARRLDPEKLAVAKAELEKLVDLGVAYRGKSEWSSPLLVTTKPCGGWRVCGDYRRLNSMTTDDMYPVRTLQDFTSELSGKKFFSKIDLMKGYHQIPVTDSDVRKTAVITPFGLFIFPRTPFGLKNAGQDFQRLMDEILGDLPRVYVYIDDILVASVDQKQHLEDLASVFKTLSANGMVIQRSKCVLGQPKLEFLGYSVDEHGISPLPEKVEAIRSTLPPTTVKELQRFLGMVGYYRKFIPNAAVPLFHLFEALKGKPKTLTWTDETQKSFDATKEALAKASMLFHPRQGSQLALTTDASNLAIGGVLEQRGPKGWEPIAFYSSKLEPHQQNWPPYDRELLGAFKSVRHFKHMLEGRKFTLYTDHASLVPSMAKKSDPQTIRQTYQLACISEYTTDIRYLQGKANVVADALSRPNEEALGINNILQDESRDAVTVSSIDAAHPAAYGDVGPDDASYLNNTTSGPSLGTQKCNPVLSGATGGAVVAVHPVSTLPRIDAKPLVGSGSDSLGRQPQNVPPSPPKDFLPRGRQHPAAASNDIENSHFAASTSISSSTPPTAARDSIDDLHCVVNSIGDLGIDWEAIALQQPLDPEFRRLRTDARSGLNFKSIDIGRSSLIVDISNGPARPYVPFSFRRRIFDVIHGLGHPGVERTRQSVSSKVVWPSMREDVSKWARECIQCQQAKVTRHTVPPIGDFPVPEKRFQHLNIDLVTLPLSNGFKYLLTIVDRFTRWPVAIPLVDIGAQSVVDAFAYGWIQTFGVPSTVTSDRGSQFTSAIFTQLTKIWGIKTITTTPYHPEANGLVERFHRRLKEALIALGADEPHQWFWRLPCVMLAIRTTVKPDINAAPADLVFGEGLAVPGEMLPSNPAAPDDLVRQRAAALSDLRLEVARLQPTETSAHRRPVIHLPPELHNCSHVFVRRGGVQSSLASPYVGPFRVIDRNDVNFRIAIPGRPNESVAISRVKPAFTSADDAEDAAPPSPPPPGRRPRPPPLPPRQDPDADADAVPPTPRRNPRRRRRQDVPAPRPESPPPPPLSPVPSGAPQTPPVEIPEADAPPRTPPPLPVGQNVDWFSPGRSPPRHPASPPRPVPRPVSRPISRPFSRPVPGNFSFRRRPDVSALVAAVHEHLGPQLPLSTSTS